MVRESLLAGERPAARHFGVGGALRLAARQSLRHGDRSL